MTSRPWRSIPRPGAGGSWARLPVPGSLRGASGPRFECGRVGAMRLAKFLAHSGVASRRSAEQMIAAGRVTVGGGVVTDPARDVDESSDVAVDGKLVEPEAREVFALNKPAGVVSTAKDTHGRQTVVSLVPSARRLYPVGRLDAD